jgi:hypothetical protein
MIKLARFKHSGNLNIFMLYLCIAMKKIVTLCLLLLFCTVFIETVQSQCSICTKTAQQLGEGPAQGLNSGIIYLMFTPFAIVGFIGYRWWKTNKEADEMPDA